MAKKPERLTDKLNLSLAKITAVLSILEGSEPDEKRKGLLRDAQTAADEASEAFGVIRRLVDQI